MQCVYCRKELKQGSKIETQQTAIVGNEARIVPLNDSLLFCTLDHLLAYFRTPREQPMQSPRRLP